MCKKVVVGLGLCFVSIMMGWMSAGCSPTFPESNVNYSPYFPPTIPNPKLKIVSIKTTTDPSGVTRFGLKRVDDQNHTDTIYAYWFLGLQLDNNAALRCQQLSLPPSQPAGATSPTTVRNAEFYCDIKHNDPLFSKGKSIELELYVVDRKADETKLKGQSTLTWPDGAKWQKHSWTLKIE